MAPTHIRGRLRKADGGSTPASFQCLGAAQFNARFSTGEDDHERGGYLASEEPCVTRTTTPAHRTRVMSDTHDRRRVLRLLSFQPSTSAQFSPVVDNRGPRPMRLLCSSCLPALLSLRLGWWRLIRPVKRRERRRS